MEILTRKIPMFRVGSGHIVCIYVYCKNIFIVILIFEVIFFRVTCHTN